MRRPRAVIAVALALLALALVFAACGGEDDEGTTTNRAPSEAPAGGAAPPGLGALPPGIAECLADQGYEIEPSELHSVPRQVLQTCFNALHQGGGAP
jgi:hypothetical protein